MYDSNEELKEIATEVKKYLGNETPKYRMITTLNAQITKWSFCALGFVIGFLVSKYVF